MIIVDDEGLCNYEGDYCNNYYVKVININMQLSIIHEDKRINLSGQGQEKM